MQVLWNGKAATPFHPQRGIRQGDPLSPCIFVLCMERLSQAINSEVEELRCSTETSQAALIHKLLTDFCAASGHIVSAAKTRVHFSRNTSHHEARRICDQLGYQKTENLGRYLGVPLLHKRITKDTYRYIEDSINKKLSGWKAKSLSLAGRITLAQSVLSTIPFFAMQTTKLPAATCHRIETLIRNFIWGDSESHKSIHLVNWSTLCQPKNRGGCGLKKLEGQNKAFIMKLAYTLKTQGDRLWVQVLQAKYIWDKIVERPANAKHISHLWRSLYCVWDELDLGIKWKDEDLRKPISMFVDGEGHWRETAFKHLLPPNTVSEIRKINPPKPFDPPAVWKWHLNGSRGFSVKSAYNLIQSPVWNDENRNIKTHSNHQLHQRSWNLSWSLSPVPSCATRTTHYNTLILWVCASEIFTHTPLVSLDSR
ncbi:uncharacterized protein LOC114732140 [Neltuma alba]|uniref:uncharacterized protein LOC114732140 n=1 Tax=Neltuma alba TaxID=207710 RepID=UPI0010A4C713|nr:uncharacterized protein LOC114732140 [Prosopis alba]